MVRSHPTSQLNTTTWPLQILISLEWDLGSHKWVAISISPSLPKAHSICTHAHIRQLRSMIWLKENPQCINSFYKTTIAINLRLVGCFWPLPMWGLSRDFMYCTSFVTLPNKHFYSGINNGFIHPPSHPTLPNLLHTWLLRYGKFYFILFFKS